MNDAMSLVRGGREGDCNVFSQEKSKPLSARPRNVAVGFHPRQTLHKRAVQLGGTQYVSACPVSRQLARHDELQV